MRQWLITKLTYTPPAGDTDDWQLHYPKLLVAWVDSMMRATENRYTPAQILDSEDRYPGLWQDLFTYRWQERLINEELKP